MMVCGMWVNHRGYTRAGCGYRITLIRDMIRVGVFSFYGKLIIESSLDREDSMSAIVPTVFGVERIARGAQSTGKHCMYIYESWQSC